MNEMIINNLVMILVGTWAVAETWKIYRRKKIEKREIKEGIKIGDLVAYQDSDGRFNAFENNKSAMGRVEAIQPNYIGRDRMAVVREQSGERKILMARTLIRVVETE